MSHAFPTQFVGEKLGNLRECEDENEIEEQFEGFDGAFTLVRLGDFCSKVFSGFGQYLGAL